MFTRPGSPPQGAPGIKPLSCRKPGETPQTAFRGEPVPPSPYGCLDAPLSAGCVLAPMTVGALVLRHAVFCEQQGGHVRRTVQISSGAVEKLLTTCGLLCIIRFGQRVCPAPGCAGKTWSRLPPPDGFPTRSPLGKPSSILRHRHVHRRELTRSRGTAPRRRAA